MIDGSLHSSRPRGSFRFEKETVPYFYPWWMNRDPKGRGERWRKRRGRGPESKFENLPSDENPLLSNVPLEGSLSLGSLFFLFLRLTGPHSECGH